jgi:ABC-2 type transport system ATP-binding protein
VLDDISFDVCRGEIFGLVGPSGAGKSTTLRVLATVLEPTGGLVEIGGIDAALEPERIRKRIGYASDQAGTYANLTVDEYLLFFAAAYHLALRSSVERALELASLTGVRDELVTALPKRKRQLVQLARALLHNPELLLLDEAASHLDPASKVQMGELFSQLHEAGKTLVLSAPALSDLSGICTSVAVLKKGRLLAAGAVADVALAFGGEAAAAAPGPGEQVSLQQDNGARRILLRLLGPAEHAVSTVRQLPATSSVIASGTQLSVELRGGERAVAQLVRRLVEAGYGVVAVRAEKGELESAFLELATTRTEP